MPEIIFRQIESAKNFELVAEIGGEVAARAGFQICLDAAEVENFQVAPKFQGRGVGKKLLATLIENARAFRLKTMIFDVRVSNVPALHILQKSGFKIVGRRKFFCEGEDAVTLTADLENFNANNFSHDDA